MRRAPIVITATVVGTAGVLLFKPVTASSVSAPTSTSGSEASGTTTTPSAAAPSPSASASAGAGSSASAVTETGTAVTTRFGTTQVKVTISGGRITAVTTLSINEDDPRSTSISEQAIPILREEVLSKQTAAVDTVSGATYTSEAYEASLQAALDKAHYTAPDGTKASETIQAEGGH